VFCIQNHDQIGNRADGARLHHHVDLATYRALSTLLLLAPATPLLFMGQEWAASSPFLFFTDFDRELGRQVTEGRRQEFSSFAAFADPQSRLSIPDPQACETFVRSRLDWRELEDPVHAGVRRLYSRLLAIRRAAGVFGEPLRGSYHARVLDDHTVAVEYATGRLVVIARLGGGSGEVTCEVAGSLPVRLTSEDPEFTADVSPLALARDDRGLHLRFERPGALVLWAD